MPRRSIGLDWFAKMWARAETFASLLLKLVPPEFTVDSLESLVQKFVPDPFAGLLQDVLGKITAALNEQADKLKDKAKDKADSLSSRLKSAIATGKQLIDGSITFEKPVYFLNVCPAKVTRPRP